MKGLVTAARQHGSKRRVLVLAALGVAVTFVDVGAGVGDRLLTGDDQARETPEPVLSGVSSRSTDGNRAPRQNAPSAWTGRHAPVVVQALAPGQVPDARAGSEARPPEHIRRENVRLRRELRHLRALEAERRRVARALAAAGVFDGGALVGSGRLIWPISGPLTSPFGQRWGRLHAGIDISAPAGTPIRAADSGRVALAGWQGGYGLYTCVKHTSSLSTCYAHQSRLSTTPGAVVRQGQVIGYVGNTGHSFGNHLHFETWVRGRPVDPMGFL